MAKEKSDERLIVLDAGRGFATSLIVTWHLYETYTWSPLFHVLAPA